jgi:hypothetical protein
VYRFDTPLLWATFFLRCVSYDVFETKIIGPLTSSLKAGSSLRFYIVRHLLQDLWRALQRLRKRGAVPNLYCVSAWRLFKHNSNFTLEKQGGGITRCIFHGISLAMKKRVSTITEYVRLERITFQTGDGMNANQTRINRLTSCNLTPDNNKEINRSRNCLIIRQLRL